MYENLIPFLYISVKGQVEFYKAQVEREKYKIKTMPEVEKEEIRCIYRKKGFKGKLLEQVVKTLTANKKRWLKVMLEEELGITETSFLDPRKAGFYIGIAFIIAGFIPLLPFLIAANGTALKLPIALSAIFLFGAGVWKTKVTNTFWLKSGVESLIIGALATLAGHLMANSGETLKYLYIYKYLYDEQKYHHNGGCIRAA